MLGNSLFGAAMLTETPDPDKYSYLAYGIGLGAGGNFSLSDRSGFWQKVT